MKLRSTLQKAALLVASAAVGLVIMEGWLRLRYPIGSVISQPDERLLYRLIPGGRRLSRSPDGANVLFELDGKGFRGNGFTEPRRGPRVVVYGDSFVEGAFSPVSETFVAKLQSELRARLGQPDLEAINAGVVGYGPDQAALRAEEELDRLAPDLLVLGVFSGNDFGDLVRDKLFRLGDRGELTENRPVPGTEFKKSFDRARQRRRQLAVVRAVNAAWARLRRPAPPKSWPNYIDEALALRQKEFEDYLERTDVVNFTADGYDADLAIEPDAPSAKLKTALMSAVLARLDGVLRAHQVPWLVVVIPDPIDVAAPDFELQVDESRYPSYDPRRLTRQLVQIAESLDLSCVDLFDALTERGGERLFFRGDNHWNAAGQAKAAATVAAAIARQPGPLQGPPSLPVSR